MLRWVLLLTCSTVPSAKRAARPSTLLEAEKTEVRVEVDYLAVTEEKVKRLCIPSVVDTGCDLLGEDRAQGLEEVLSLHGDQLNQLLNALGLPKTFTCQDLCESSVKHIPSILKAGIPHHAEEGCLSADCLNIADVSLESLREINIKTEVRDGDEKVIVKGGARGGSTHSVGTEQLLRRLLGVVLRVFPAMDVEDADVGALLETEQLDEADPKFGSRIRDDRKEEYARYNALAFSWVSEAIRKLSVGRAHVARWFNLHTDYEITQQIKQARMHLTMMLDLYGKIYIKKGKETWEGGACKESQFSGTMAYVETFVGCEVTHWKDCGVKEDGRYVVNICEFLWKSVFTEADRVGTIVHESSHHFGTDDNGYCDAVDCQKLQPALATTNADSYATLVANLVKDTSLIGSGEPQRPPCTDSSQSGLSSGGRGLGCREALELTSCHSPDWGSLLMSNCRVSCNNCPAVSPPQLDYEAYSCRDRADSGLKLNGVLSTCKQVKAAGVSCFGQYAKVLEINCPQTCGHCPAGSNATSTSGTSGTSGGGGGGSSTGKNSASAGGPGLAAALALGAALAAALR